MKKKGKYHEGNEQVPRLVVIEGGLSVPLQRPDPLQEGSIDRGRKRIRMVGLGSRLTVTLAGWEKSQPAFFQKTLTRINRKRFKHEGHKGHDTCAARQCGEEDL